MTRPLGLVVSHDWHVQLCCQRSEQIRSKPSALDRGRSSVTTRCVLELGVRCLCSEPFRAGCARSLYSYRVRPEPRCSHSLLRCINFLRISRFAMFVNPLASVYLHSLAIHLVAQSLGHEFRLASRRVTLANRIPIRCASLLPQKQRSNLNQLGDDRSHHPEPGLLLFVWQCLGFVRQTGTRGSQTSQPQTLGLLQRLHQA